MPSVEYTLDPARIDAVAAHAFLVDCYWSRGIPLSTVRRAIDHSICVAALLHGRQIAFARLVTDRATFAYLADVYVLPDHRGQGISKRMLQTLFDHPDVQGLRRLLLVTRDAHRLYQQFGFQSLASPAGFMEKHNPHIYQSANIGGG